MSLAQTLPRVFHRSEPSGAFTDVLSVPLVCLRVRVRVCPISCIGHAEPAEYMKYLLEHDTVHGRFTGTVIAQDDALVINGQRVSLSKTRDASMIPWASSGVEYVLECTGAFLTTEKCQAHLEGGAKKVVISAPASDSETPTLVVGVNADTYDTRAMAVVSCASCTTNGLAPLVKVIHERFGIAEGLMTTIHAATASQVIVDGTSNKDWRAGRAASANIIPASTGAAKAVAKAYPPMKGRLTGMAVRVPVVDVSMIDLTLTLERPTTYEEIKAEVRRASETYAAGIIGYTEEAVVSSDFIGETRSTVFDAKAGLMLSPTFVKLISWYDNEWGYSSRLCDLVLHMAKADGVFDKYWSFPEPELPVSRAPSYPGPEEEDLARVEAIGVDASAQAAGEAGAGTSAVARPKAVHVSAATIARTSAGAASADSVLATLHQALALDDDYELMCSAGTQDGFGGAVVPAS